MKRFYYNVVIGALLLISGYSFADTPASWITFRLVLKDGRSYDLHIIAPSSSWAVENETLGYIPPLQDFELSRNAATGALERVADFIDADAVSKGYINDITRPFHEAEISQLKTGSWPTVFLTPPDDPYTILLALSIAASLDGSPPPFFNRFRGKGISKFPKSADYFTSPHIIRHGEPFAFTTDRPHLSRIYTQLPWAVGASAEIKFLVKAESFNEDLMDLIYSTVLSGQLHRFSLTEVDAKLLAEQRRIYTESTFLRWHLALLDRTLSSIRTFPLSAQLMMENTKRIFKWKQRARTGGVFQRVLLNSNLYVQVSEPDRVGPGSPLPLNRWYTQHIGLPKKPWLDFIETETSGTPGIRTRIYQIPLDYYDNQMLDHFQIRDAVDISEFYRLTNPVRPDDELSCVQRIRQPSRLSPDRRVRFRK